MGNSVCHLGTLKEERRLNRQKSLVFLSNLRKKSENDVRSIFYWGLQCFLLSEDKRQTTRHHTSWVTWLMRLGCKVGTQVELYSSLNRCVATKFLVRILWIPVISSNLRWIIVYSCLLSPLSAYLNIYWKFLSCHSIIKRHLSFESERRLNRKVES